MLLKAFTLLAFVFSTLATSGSKKDRAPTELARQCRAHGCTAQGLTPRDSSSPKQDNSFKHEITYMGEDFFTEWDFFTDDDPTHGLVDYQGRAAAQQKHLAYVEGGTTILAVDSKSTLGTGHKRASVRITSKKSWNGGLFIADFSKVPFGCSVWPAYWSVGPDWPNGGEIDVMEGVNDQATNRYTLHTFDGCKASPGAFSPTGKATGTNCLPGAGCAYVDTDPRSFNAGFNEAGGGVFAHLWDHTGIRIWHFARDEVPIDIQRGNPDPDSWGPPAAAFSSDTCDIAKHFHDHRLVINTTLCGDWAGATYASSTCPGTCNEAVSDPDNFKNAKWAINYVSVYQVA